LVDLLHSEGVDTDATLARAGLPRNALGAGRVPLPAINRLWDAAVELTGNDLLGLSIASRIEPEMLDVVGYLGKASKHLEEVILRASRYGRVLDSSFRFALDVSGDEAIVRLLDLPALPRHPQVAECILAAVGRIARIYTGTHLVPREVRFMHDHDRRERALGVAFEGKVTFRAAHNALVFDRSYLSLPVPTSDPRLAAILERQAEHMLAELPQTEDLVQRAYQAILERVPNADATSASVAHALGLGERTLRRRLDELGTSYQALLDRVRFELARRYLCNTSMEVARIAISLGFSDPSAFARAFKRWAGMTPAEFRRTSASTVVPDRAQVA
jgi:AraC-like DNA-binding protein